MTIFHPENDGLIDILDNMGLADSLDAQHPSSTPVATRPVPSEKKIHTTS